MNRTAKVLTESAALLLGVLQHTIEDVGRAIITPARNERGALSADEEKDVEKLSQIQDKLREVQFLFGDFK